jgi:N-acetylglucosaminyl-diphospho-decaprenol L-rhamnosyltransferase
MDDTYVVVSIVSYKSAKLTVDCLQSIQADRSIEGLNVKVVVVDNASGDTPEILDAVSNNQWQDWVTVLTAPKNGGFAYGNNYAFQYAFAHGKVDFFHLLNPDTQIRPGAISALVEFMKANPTTGIAGGSFDNQDGSLWPIAFRFPSMFSEFESGVKLGLLSKLLKPWVVAVPMQQKPQPIDWIAGASMMLRRSVVEELHGFDESYFLYYEETDFCLRAKRAGFSTWYVPTSRVMHIAGQSTKVTIRNDKPKRLPDYWFESRRRYFIANYGVFYTLLTDIAGLFGNLIGKIKRILTGKQHEDVPSYISDIFRHSVLLPSNWHVKPFLSCLHDK